MAEKKLKLDVGGFEIITSAIQNLLDRFPGLQEDEAIVFSNLGEESGIAWYPNSGGVIEKEKENIIGHVYQTCVYPFYIVYRSGGTSSRRKLGIKEFLDSIGCWMEKQPVKVDDTEYVLSEYPALTGGRKVLSISRQSPAYLDHVSENNIEDWVIMVALKYKNEFDR